MPKSRTVVDTIRVDRDLEEVNKPCPRKKVFVGNAIAEGIATAAVGICIGGVMWLAMIGLDTLFMWMGI